MKKRLYMLWALLSVCLGTWAQTKVVELHDELPDKRVGYRPYVDYKVKMTLPEREGFDPTEMNAWLKALLGMPDADPKLSLEEVMRMDRDRWFSDYKKDWLEEGDFTPSQAFELNVMIEADEYGFISLCYNKWVNMGGAHGQYEFGGASFDPKTGERWKWEDYFDDKDAMRPFLTYGFENAFDQRNPMDFEAMFAHTGTDYNNYPLPKRDPWISPNYTINFSYDAYEAGPYAMGTPHTRIMASLLEPVLSQKMHELLLRPGMEADGRGDFSTLMVYVSDKDETTNVRNAPRGKVVGQLHNGDMIEIEEGSENGWFRIHGKRFEDGGDGGYISYEPGVDLWIHSSVISCDWVVDGNTEVKIYAEPSSTSQLIIKAMGTELKIERILDVTTGDWVKIRTNRGTGWVEAGVLCGNSLTICC